MQTSNINTSRKLAVKVNKLAKLNATIRRLSLEADDIKEALKASGFDVVEGTQHRAVMTVREVAALDGQAVRKLLTPEQITACTRVRIQHSVCLYDL